MTYRYEQTRTDRLAQRLALFASVLAKERYPYINSLAGKNCTFSVLSQVMATRWY